VVATVFLIAAPAMDPTSAGPASSAGPGPLSELRGGASSSTDATFVDRPKRPVALPPRSVIEPVPLPARSTVLASGTVAERASATSPDEIAGLLVRSPQAPPPPDPSEPVAWLAALGARDGSTQPVDAGVPFEVTLYGADWCGYTRQARAWLRSVGVAVVEHDIDRDPRARARLLELNPRGSVPTFDVRGRVLVGFSPGALARVMEQAAAGAP
jgi:glutaredoxin